MKRILTVFSTFWFLTVVLPQAALRTQGKPDKQEQQKQEEPKGPLSGAWKGAQHLPQMPDRDFRLELEQRGERINGKASTSEGNAPIKGTFKDGVLKAAVESDQGNYEVEGKLDGDKLSGNWVMASTGTKGTWEATREGLPKGPLSGGWKCVSRGPDVPENEFQLDLDQRGDKITGMGSNAQGSTPLKGSFDNGSFKIVVPTGAGNYELEGKLEGDKLSGNWTFTGSGAKGTWEGKRI